MVPYKYASRVFLMGPSIIERILIRIWKWVGCQDSIWLRRLNQRKTKLRETLWNGETKEEYDAVIYCGPVPCIVGRTSRRIPLVYDCMDQWDGFPDAHPKTVDFEDSLAKSADIIWTVTPYLTERLSRKHGANKCHLVPNGCDYDHFSTPKTIIRPSIWKPNSAIIGYAGVVGEWFDWDPVLTIARTLPGVIIWIIGTCHAKVPDNLPPNIVLEGFVPYEQLPDYYAGFDVSIIPFRGDSLLKGVSPIKLYEYLAAGKPVIASKMPDAMHLAEPGIVEVALVSEQFAPICSSLIDQARNEALIRRRRELAQSHSWTARWEICESLIKGFNIYNVDDVHLR
jgi:glycosyltransferase involved in cell wall biosynthesis